MREKKKIKKKTEKERGKSKRGKGEQFKFSHLVRLNYVGFRDTLEILQG